MATILFWPQCVKYNTLTKYLHRFVDPRRHFCDLPVGKHALFLLTTPRPLMISTYLRHSTWGLRLAVLAELPRPSPVDPSRLDAVTVQIIKQVYGKMEKGRNSIDIALELRLHYSDVVMGAMAYQITSLAIVYSTVYSGAYQRKHQSYAPLAFVWGIHRWPVHSPHKWPVTGKCFHLMTSSCFPLNHRSYTENANGLSSWHPHSPAPFTTTSSHWNVFRAIGPLWRESTGHQRIAPTKVKYCELWCFRCC